MFSLIQWNLRLYSLEGLDEALWFRLLRADLPQEKALVLFRLAAESYSLWKLQLTPAPWARVTWISGQGFGICGFAVLLALAGPKNTENAGWSYNASSFHALQ